MGNTILNNLGRDNNSISPLHFTWVAIFKDGTKIKQYKEDGTENRFKLVKDRFNDLVYFNLTNNKGKLFTVSLETGIIGYNYLALPYIESKETKKNIRLIFFRRHRVEITEKNEQKSHIINYHLGLQYLDKNNNNKQIVLQINQNGDFIIGG